MGNDQEPIQSNSTSCPTQHMGKECKQLSWHKVNSTSRKPRAQLFPSRWPPGGKAILMSFHNLRFYGELTKIILQLSLNTLLICSPAEWGNYWKLPFGEVNHLFYVYKLCFMVLLTRCHKNKISDRRTDDFEELYPNHQPYLSHAWENVYAIIE